MYNHRLTIETYPEVSLPVYNHGITQLSTPVQPQGNCVARWEYCGYNCQDYHLFT